MKDNADFQEGISQTQRTATLLPTSKFLTTNKSFQMRYCIRIFLKGHANCPGVKAKSSEKPTFYQENLEVEDSNFLLF